MPAAHISPSPLHPSPLGASPAASSQLQPALSLPAQHSRLSCSAPSLPSRPGGLLKPSRHPQLPPFPSVGLQESSAARPARAPCWQELPGGHRIPARGGLPRDARVLSQGSGHDGDHTKPSLLVAHSLTPGLAESKEQRSSCAPTDGEPPLPPPQGTVPRSLLSPPSKPGSSEALQDRARLPRAVRTRPVRPHTRRKEAEGLGDTAGAQQELLLLEEIRTYKKSEKQV